MTRTLDTMAYALRRFLGLCYRNQNLLFVVSALVTMSAFAFVSGYWFFYRAAYVLGGLVIICLIWARVHAGALEVAVERANDRLQVGQEAEAKVRLRSRSKFTKVWLEAEDETDMPGTPARTVLTLSSNGSRNWKVNVRCARRGIYRAGPVRITTGDPFGLFRFMRSYGERRQLLLLPHPYAQSNRILGLMALGKEAVVLDPTRGSQQYGRILEALAMAEATGVKPLSLVLEEEGRRFGRHTTLIIVTPSADDGWLASL